VFWCTARPTRVAEKPVANVENTMEDTDERTRHDLRSEKRSAMNANITNTTNTIESTAEPRMPLYTDATDDGMTRKSCLAQTSSRRPVSFGSRQTCHKPMCANGDTHQSGSAVATARDTIATTEVKIPQRARIKGGGA
jgi:hypothetical protein